MLLDFLREAITSRPGQKLGRYSGELIQILTNDRNYHYKNSISKPLVTSSPSVLPFSLWFSYLYPENEDSCFLMPWDLLQPL